MTRKPTDAELRIFRALTEPLEPLLLDQFLAARRDAARKAAVKRGKKAAKP